MVTAGGASTMTLTFTLALALRPALSTTRAVIVCVPWLRFERLKLPPVPRLPSRLDVHWMLGVKLPSKGSLAVAKKLMGAPKANILPSIGELRVRVGVEAVATWMVA